MAELMLLNPSPRRKAKRKASPAQLRALAAGRRKRADMAVNPAPRKRRTTLRAASHTPTKRRKARRNPVGGMPTHGLMGSLLHAAYGAGGALAIDVAVTYLPLPASLTTGNAKYLTKAALAVSLGIIGKKFLGRTAAKMAEGALTVQAYEFGKSLMQSAGMNLAYMSPAQTMLPNSGMAQYLNAPGIDAGMGEYVGAQSNYSY